MDNFRPRTPANGEESEKEVFGGLSREEADKVLFACFHPDPGDAVKDFGAALAASVLALGYDIKNFDFDAFYDGRWVKHIILKAVSDAKYQGRLKNDDAEIVERCRADFESYASILLDQTAAFLSGGRSSISLQRGTVQGLRSFVVATIEAAFTIGATVGISESTKWVLKARQAEIARKARAAKPQEIALGEIISSELGNRSVPRPAKEAAAILDSVNARLGAAGFPPVSVDVVYRRLKKIPRC